jgi:hypothetical protein
MCMHELLIRSPKSTSDTKTIWVIHFIKHEEGRSHMCGLWDLRRDIHEEDAKITLYNLYRALPLL